MKYDLIDDDSVQTTVHVFRCVYKGEVVQYLTSIKDDYTHKDYECTKIATGTSGPAVWDFVALLNRERTVMRREPVPDSSEAKPEPWPSTWPESEPALETEPGPASGPAPVAQPPKMRVCNRCSQEFEKGDGCVASGRDYCSRLCYVLFCSRADEGHQTDKEAKEARDTWEAGVRWEAEGEA